MKREGAGGGGEFKRAPRHPLLIFKVFKCLDEQKSIEEMKFIFGD